MGNRRYPGPKPFAAAQANLFHGRDEEQRQLSRLVANRQMTVLYGKSGLGKSSLLNAAVLPQMQKKGFHIIPVRLGAWTPESGNTPLRSTVQAIAENEEHLDETILDELVPFDNSLWYFTKTFQLNSERQQLLFVFDQFEELFTYPIGEIENYKKDLAELLTTAIPQRYREAMDTQDNNGKSGQYKALFDRLEIKVIFAIRSNRYHLLERLTDALPQILHHNMELQPLSREGARSAVVKPAKDESQEYESAVFEYSLPAQEDILTYLTEEQRVEGILLQILCAYIEDKVVIGKQDTYIEPSDLPQLRSIVKDYYTNRIAEFSPEIQERVKRFIEDGLVQQVGDGGMRLSMHEAQVKERFGLDEDILKRLLENGLLRSDPYLRGGVTYELTHDRLLEPVLEAKEAYQAEEAQRLKDQLTAEENKRKEAEYLRGKAEAALEEAERQQRIAEEAEKKAKRNTLYATFAFVLAFIGLLAAGWLYKDANDKKEEILRKEAAKNLLLCKELLADAEDLLETGYCQSAQEKLSNAEVLIEENQEYDAGFDREQEKLQRSRNQLNRQCKE